MPPAAAWPARVVAIVLGCANVHCMQTLAVTAQQPVVDLARQAGVAAATQGCFVDAGVMYIGGNLYNKGAGMPVRCATLQLVRQCSRA